MWISLGCALENFVLAAGAAGFAAQIRYPETSESIQIVLTPAEKSVHPLFDAIPLRQTTRSAYDGRRVSEQDFAVLQATPLEPGVTLHWLTDPAQFETARDYVSRGSLAQYENSAFTEELIGWLRFTRKDALKTRDGLFTHCSGNPEVLRWLGRLFVRGTKPQQQAEQDARKFGSAAGALVIASEMDDPSSWVRTGQVYQRLALQMTVLNIQSALDNQPIEVPAQRAQFQAAISLGARLPQLLIRFGYAAALPKALRRPVDQVLHSE